MVNIHMYDLEFDSDEEEDFAEDLIVESARAASVCALFATVLVLQTRYNYACPTFVTKTLKTLIKKPSYL